MDSRQALAIAKGHLHLFTRQPAKWQIDSIRLARLTGDLWYYWLEFRSIEPGASKDVIQVPVSFSGEIGTFEPSECMSLPEATGEKVSEERPNPSLQPSRPGRC